MPTCVGISLAYQNMFGNIKIRSRLFKSPQVSTKFENGILKYSVGVKTCHFALPTVQRFGLWVNTTPTGKESK